MKNLLRPIANYGLPLAFSAGCLLLLAPIFLSTAGYNAGYQDFLNHAWLGGLYANELLSTGAFPLVINTNETIGDALPLFYGGLTHAVIAIPATILGPLQATKLIMALLLVGTVATVFSYLDDHSHENEYTNLFFAFCFGICDYFLTNLYSRGALTEFVSVNLLVISLIYYFRYKNTRAERELLLSMAFACCSIAAHSLAVVLILVAVPVWLLMDREKIFELKLLVKSWRGLVLLLCAALIVSPIVMFSEYTTSIRGQSMIVYPFDNILERLLPGILDARMLSTGKRFTELTTPFLTGTLNAGAAILVFSAANSRLKSVFMVGLALTLLLSTGDLPAFGYLPDIFKAPQFYYRYCSLTQLWILGFFLHIVQVNREPLFEGKKLLILGLCIGVFSLSMSIKITDAFLAYRAAPAFDVAAFANFDKYPLWFYGAGTYQRPDLPSIPGDVVPASDGSIDLRLNKRSLENEIRLNLPPCEKESCLFRLRTNVFSNPVLRVAATVMNAEGRKVPWGGIFYQGHGTSFDQYDLRVKNPNANISVRFYAPAHWVAFKYARTLVLLLFSVLVYFLLLASIKVSLTSRGREAGPHLLPVTLPTD